jgi:hypothetical protein
MRVPCVNITAKMKEMDEATKRTVLILIKSIAVDMYCNTPGVIVLINLPCHHNALQSIHV